MKYPYDLQRNIYIFSIYRTEPVTRNDSYRRSDPPSGYWVRADNRPNSPDNGPHKVYVLAPTKSEPSVPKVYICYTHRSCV